MKVHLCKAGKGVSWFEPVGLEDSVQEESASPGEVSEAAIRQVAITDVVNGIFMLPQGMGPDLMFVTHHIHLK